MNDISQIDPNVKVPAAVRAQVARSNQIIEQLKAQQEAEPEVTSNGNRSADPAASFGDLTNKTIEQPATAEPAPAPTSPDEESWEHKYKSMHGRFIRSQEQVRSLGEQISSMQNMIASLQVAQQSTPLPSLSSERFLTDEEERDYGTDFLNVVGKKAREEFMPIAKGYEQKISELEARLQGVHGVVAQDTQSKMFNALDERLPTWRELNYNQDFLDWLKLPDPYSGANRHEMLKAAYAQSNASRVLAFFNGFLAEEAVVDPASSGPDSGASYAPKVPLASLAAPGRAKTAAATAPTEKPIFTRAQIAAFYSDVAANRYRGRDAEKSKVEASIFEAQRDGRIR